MDKFLYDQAARIGTLIATRKEKESVETILNEIREKLNGASDGSDAMAIDAGSSEDTVREVFLQCLMFHGSKSFSHLLSVVERYEELLLTFPLQLFMMCLLTGTCQSCKLSMHFQKPRRILSRSWPRSGSETLSS